MAFLKKKFKNAGRQIIQQNNEQKHDAEAYGDGALKPPPSPQAIRAQYKLVVNSLVATGKKKDKTLNEQQKLIEKLQKKIKDLKAKIVKLSEKKDKEKAKEEKNKANDKLNKKLDDQTEVIAKMNEELQELRSDKKENESSKAAQEKLIETLNERIDKLKANQSDKEQQDIQLNAQTKLINTLQAQIRKIKSDKGIIIKGKDDDGTNAELEKLKAESVVLNQRIAKMRIVISSQAKEDKTKVFKEQIAELKEENDKKDKMYQLEQQKNRKMSADNGKLNEKIMEMRRSNADYKNHEIRKEELKQLKAENEAIKEMYDQQITHLNKLSDEESHKYQTLQIANQQISEKYKLMDSRHQDVMDKVRGNAIKWSRKAQNLEKQLHQIDNDLYFHTQVFKSIRSEIKGQINREMLSAPNTSRLPLIKDEERLKEASNVYVKAVTELDPQEYVRAFQRARETARTCTSSNLNESTYN